MQEVEELVLCHNEHPLRKFFGHCNEYKEKLDRCFKVRREREHESPWHLDYLVNGDNELHAAGEKRTSS